MVLTATLDNLVTAAALEEPLNSCSLAASEREKLKKIIFLMKTIYLIIRDKTCQSTESPMTSLERQFILTNKCLAI